MSPRKTRESTKKEGDTQSPKSGIHPQGTVKGILEMSAKGSPFGVGRPDQTKGHSASRRDVTNGNIKGMDQLSYMFWESIGGVE